MTMTEPSFLGTILCSERFSPATFENLLNHETYVVQQCIDLLGKEIGGGGGGVRLFLSGFILGRKL